MTGQPTSATSSARSCSCSPTMASWSWRRHRWRKARSVDHDGLVEGPPGRGDGPVHVHGRGVGGLAEHLLGGRVDVVEPATVGGVDQLRRRSGGGTPRSVWWRACGAPVVWGFGWMVLGSVPPAGAVRARSASGVGDGHGRRPAGGGGLGGRRHPGRGDRVDLHRGGNWPRAPSPFRPAGPVPRDRRAAGRVWHALRRRVGRDDGGGTGRRRRIAVQRVPMNLSLSEESRRFRDELRQWLDANVEPTPTFARLRRGVRLGPAVAGPAGGGPVGRDPLAGRVRRPGRLTGRGGAVQHRVRPVAGAPAGQPDRGEPGGPHPARPRRRRPAAPVAARDPGRRRDLVPAVQRARRRIGPRVADHPRRGHRGRLGGRGPEGVDQLRPVLPVGDRTGPHRSRRPAPPGDLLRGGGHVGTRRRGPTAA